MAKKRKGRVKGYSYTRKGKLIHVKGYLRKQRRKR